MPVERLLGAGSKQPPQGKGPGGAPLREPEARLSRARAPTTIEMLLAFLIVGLRDTLADGTVSLTLTAAKYSVNLQLPCVLLLMIMFAMIWQDHRRR